jgi:hypothetical protein
VHACSNGAGYGVVSVVGDGTLVFEGGGTLVVARGLPHAHVTVRAYDG